MVDIQLLRDSPLNTVLIVDGAPLYAVKTVIKGIIPIPRQTMVRKANEDMAIEDTDPIAVIEWGSLSSKTTVQLGGQTRPWDEILSSASKGKWLPFWRTIISPTGETYIWKLERGRLFLLNPASDTIAHYTKSPFTILGPSPKAIINVTRECLPMLDLVIVTWIIMEQKRRAAAASAGSI